MIRSILFILCIFFVLQGRAQIVIMPLQYDPQREEISSSKANLRIAANPYTDTLSLPFFDDFTFTNPSIDSIYFLPDGTLQITTLGHHGLQNQEKIFMSFKETEASYLNGNYFIKNTGKSSFILYNDQVLTNPKSYPSIPNIRFHGYWKRPGARIGPNPDFTKWVDSGGTYINNTLCIGPPSKFVASFDGLNAKGNPYSGGSQRGATDNLTSLPINLSGLQASDSLVISFYWQAKGNGFLPKFLDSLYLSFKDSLGDWNYVWGIHRKGNGVQVDTTKFYRSIVRLFDPIYFYQGFQFRFQSVGNTGAAADNWNLDYIYFDKNWNHEKLFPRDRAISQSQTPLLKQYQSMPYKQFIVNKDNELADSITLSLKNLSRLENIIYFDEKYISHEAEKIPISFGNFGQILDTTSLPKYLTYTYDKNAFNFSGDSLVVKTLVSVQSSDPDNRNGIDLTTNNVDSTTTLIHNYYAYDDGSAEKSGGNIPGGPMLVKFTLNQVPDTLTGIDISFSKAYTFNSPIYSQVDLLIANKDKVVIETIKNFKPTYPGGTNNFTRATPANGYRVLTENEFYVGYFNPLPVDGNNINIPIGMDWTYPQKEEVYFKNPGFTDWGKYTGGGNYMIRPVFGKLPITGLLSPSYAALSCEVFPNPSAGVFNISGEVAQVTLFDIAGRMVLRKSFTETETVKSLDASSIKNGVYFLHLENANRKTTKKLCILRE